MQQLHNAQLTEDFRGLGADSVLIIFSFFASRKATYLTEIIPIYKTSLFFFYLRRHSFIIDCIKPCEAAIVKLWIPIILFPIVMNSLL